MIGMVMKEKESEKKHFEDRFLEEVSENCNDHKPKLHKNISMIEQYR